MSKRTESAALIAGAMLGILGNFFASSLFYFTEHSENGSTWALILGALSAICFFGLVVPVWHRVWTTTDDSEDENSRRNEEKTGVMVPSALLYIGFIATVILIIEQLVEILIIEELPTPTIQIVIMIFAIATYYLIVKVLSDVIQ